MRQGGCVTSARSVVIWGSTALAVCGWGGSVWSWLDHGHAAGVHPGFVTALSVAICFTVTLCVAVVMPDQVRLYGIGHDKGFARGYAAAMATMGGTPGDTPQHTRQLALVQH
jgi:hypothetical protein